MGTLFLKQSTAVTISFGPAVLNSDGVTYVTNLVGTGANQTENTSTGIRISKNGGALAARHATAGTSTYDAFGMYLVILDTTDTNTLGALRMTFGNAAAFCPIFQDFMVLPANMWNSLFGTGGSIPDAVAGATGGVMIAGSNAATTLASLTVTAGTTLTGNVLLSDGLTIAAPSTGNRAGLSITGNGTGEAILATGGATGNGMTLSAGATSGHGLSATATGTSFNGLNLVGSPTTGHGILTAGGSTSGSGIKATSITGDAILTAVTTSGHGATFAGTGTTKHGINATGGATSSDGIRATGGGSGTGMRIISGATGAGLSIAGGGSNPGISTAGGATGNGITILGGGTSGTGITISTTSGNGITVTPTDGHALQLSGNGTSKHGALISGGGAGTSDGISLTASSGVGLRAASWTVTGATVLTGTVTATDGSNNITGVTAALTGDLTATMKTSVTTAATAATPTAAAITDVSNIVTGGAITVSSGKLTLTSAYDYAKGTVAMTESYAANGVAPTPVQATFAIHQMLMDFNIVTTALTVKKLDNTATAFVVTLDSATAPTAAART